MAEVHRCFDCKFAKWTLTAAGRLHPSGGGLCMWEYKPPAIAAAFKWGGLSRNFAPAFSDTLLNFARLVVALQGDIPEANVKEVLPILRKVRESGLDYAAMTAALEGGN